MVTTIDTYFARDMKQSIIVMPSYINYKGHLNWAHNLYSKVVKYHHEVDEKVNTAFMMGCGIDTSIQYDMTHTTQ